MEGFFYGQHINTKYITAFFALLIYHLSKNRKDLGIKKEAHTCASKIKYRPILISLQSPLQ